MADTAILKEILFRNSAEQCKVCEAIPFEAVGHRFEYEKFKMLHEVIEKADLEDEYQEWRRAYGYVQEGGEDMEDTNMQDIQNAYQGFAKQNYTMLDRSEESREGKECMPQCRYRWSPYH